MFAFTDFCVVESVERHAWRDDGFFFFVFSEVFVLRLRSNITIFLYSVQSLPFKNYTRRISPRATRYNTNKNLTSILYLCPPETEWPFYSVTHPFYPAEYTQFCVSIVGFGQRKILEKFAITIARKPKRHKTKKQRNEENI
jgi:hypothetical protein